MEAIREGIEDHEYLTMLQGKIDELEKRRIQHPAMASAKQILNQGVARVTGVMTSSNMARWQETKDRTVADQVREEVLEQLMNLQGL